MLRRGSAGSNTAADHIALADAAIAALPPGFRRKLMVTCDGAGLATPWSLTWTSWPAAAASS
jgi:hypothetical protein